LLHLLATSNPLFHPLLSTSVSIITINVYAYHLYQRVVLWSMYVNNNLSSLLKYAYIFINVRSCHHHQYLFYSLPSKPASIITINVNIFSINVCFYHHQQRLFYRHQRLLLSLPSCFFFIFINACFTHHHQCLLLSFPSTPPYTTFSNLYSFR